MQIQIKNLTLQAQLAEEKENYTFERADRLRLQERLIKAEVQLSETEDILKASLDATIKAEKQLAEIAARRGCKHPNCAVAYSIAGQAILEKR